MRPELIELRIGGCAMMVGGAAVPFDMVSATQHMSGPEIELLVDMHTGPGTATMWTCTWGVDSV